MVMAPMLHVNGLQEIRRELRQEFARLAAEEARQSSSAVDAAMQAAVEPLAFTLSARRRVRHWVDGLVIGSDVFVRDVMCRVRPKAAVAKHRLARAASTIPGGTPICCWRRLRTIAT